MVAIPLVADPTIPCVDDSRKETLMSPLRIPVALATAGLALLCASTSFAQATQPKTQPVQTQPAQTQPVQTQPAQPQPGQAMQQPVQPQQVQPAQTVPQQQVQQQPVGTTQTTAAPYIPPGGERRETHLPNRPLLRTGAGVFLLSYAPSVVVGAMSDREADKKLYIPVAGPWMDLAHRGCTAENPCGAGEDVATAMLITSGVAQGAGILMGLGSLLIPESTTITQKTAEATKPEVRVAPISVRAGAGIAVFGRF